ncbi:MAG: hypothetical protein AAF519_01365 [Bacteroidota bacterium]
MEFLVSLTSANLKPDSSRNLQWHRRYGNPCIYPATDSYREMNFLRLVLTSNFSAFANSIGLKNRLPLDFNWVDPGDPLHIYDFVNHLRKKIEASYDNKRFEFQQDEGCRNTMFFFFPGTI